MAPDAPEPSGDARTTDPAAYARTPFVDRPREVAEILAKLATPDCRLLTLVGPGGAGKTRLAQRVLEVTEDAYAQGGTMVRLDAIGTRFELIDAVARAFGVDPSARDPEALLFAAARPADILLVLDDFESVVDEADWLGELIRHAPGVKLLVTSRESLDLEEKWIQPVGGLDIPPADASVEDDTWTAIALFRRTATRHGVRPAPADGPAAARICRFVEGLPLAIELAATWVRVMPIADIAEALEEDVGLLGGASRNADPRQRSMETVFTHSWRRLTEAQQRVLAQLAVHPGPFDRESAVAVAHAALRSLLELVSKSLLRRDDAGRFSFHPLIRQFSARRLAGMPDRDAEARDRHGAHYLDRLHRLDELRRSGSTGAFLNGIELDEPNFREMWRWAVVRRRVDELERMAGAVEHYFVQRNRYEEGIAVFGDAAEALDRNDVGQHGAIGRLLVCRGWMQLRRGAMGAARSDRERAAAFLEPLGPRTALCECVNLAGAIAGLTGEYADAHACFQRAAAMATQIGEDRYLNYYLNNLAITERNLGHYAEAEALYRQALELGRGLGETVTVVRNLNNLGLLLRARGALDDAQRCLEEALGQAEAHGLRQPLVHLYASLAKTSFDRGDLDSAAARFGQALAEARASGSRGLEAEVLAGLGMVAVERGDPDARDHLREALSLARGIGSPRTCLEVLTEVAGLWWKQGRTDEARGVLAVVLTRAESGDETRVRAERILDGVPTGPAASGGGHPGADVRPEALEATVERALRAL